MAFTTSGVTSQIEQMGLQDPLGFQVAGKPPRREDRRGTVALVANAYTMKFPDRSVYSYDINIRMAIHDKDNKRRFISIVRESKDDFMVVTSKEKCLLAFKAFTRKYDDIFKKAGQKFYDLQRLLYTTNKIFDQEQDVTILELTEEDLRADPSGGNHFVEFGIRGLDAEIKRHGNNETLFLKDFEFLTCDQVQLPLRHDLPQFLEIASSESINFGGMHVTFGGGVSYEKVDRAYCSNDLKMCNGVQKSVKFLEPRDGVSDPVPSIILDSKKAFFHVGQISIIDKVYNMKVMDSDGSIHPAKIRDLVHQLKHLFVFIKHLLSKKRKYFAICDVLTESCETKMFDYQPDPAQPVRNISVADYFAERYTPLKYPKSPVIAVRGKNGDTFYPMETLFICHDQRLTASQMTPEILSNIIKSCAVLPKNRIDEIKKQAASLKLHDPSCNLGSMEIRVNPQMMQLVGRMLNAPMLAYAANGQGRPEETGRWKTARTRYIHPMRLNNWAVYHLTDRTPNPRDINFATQFVTELRKEAQNRGMFLNDPHMATISTANLKDVFGEAREYNTEFMLFLQDESLHAHEEIKSLERYYELTTQDLNFKTVRMVIDQQKRLTLENILNKTNVKLGGVNYSIRVQGSDNFFKGGRLYLGIHASSTSVFAADDAPEVGSIPRKPNTKPLVVGVATNITAEPSAFVGDCFFTEHNIESFTTELAKCATRYARIYNDCKPLKEMIIYFNGLSEGDFLKLGEVIDAMRNDLKDFAGLKLTVMVVSKAHSVRLLPQQITGHKATEQNIKPGTVVDRDIVHAKFAEFFLNSHLTLQGTAKVAKYTLLVNDSGFDLQYLESMSYALAYGHQIVALPTSLPTPAYVARCYADRGTMLLKNFESSEAALANANLSYHNTRFQQTRINA